MARDGSGVYSKPAGTTAVSGTTIESAKFNAVIDDLVADANAARPVSAGGTGSANAADARTALGVTAANVPFTPTGNVAATTVQAAIAEVDSEKAALIGATFTNAGVALTNNINTNATNRAMWGVTTGANQRWLAGKDASAESGSNVGGNWSLERYSDAGAFLGTAIYVRRSDGTVTFELAPFVGGNVVWHAGNLVISNYAPLASPALTGSPTISGNTIYHAGNFSTIPAATTSVAGLMSAADKTNLNNAYSTSNRPPLGNQFESAQQTITLGGSYTIAHGLPARPTLVFAELECTTAEHNYSVGDRLPMPPFDASTSVISGMSIVPDATNLNIRMAATAVFIPNKTTGTVQQITTSSWRFRVRAWV